METYVRCSGVPIKEGHIVLSLLLSPVGRKISIGLSLLLIVFIFLRWYGNQQYIKGREDEKVSASEIIKEEANRARAQALDEINTLRAELNIREMILNAREEQFNRDQIRINQQFRDRMSIIDQRLLQENKNIPADSGIWDYLRQLNREYTGARNVPSDNRGGPRDGF